MGLFSNLFAGGAAAKASKKAAKAQVKGMKKGIEEQRRQFDVTSGQFAPYREAGATGLGQYGGLVGLQGPEAQQAAIDQLKQSPFYQSLYRQGEETLLQNASATGGLRGGNTERGLADFGADTLATTIDRQLGNLGGLAQMGLGSVNSLGQFGANMSSNVSDLLVGQGQAKAQDIMNRGMLQNQMWSGLGSLAIGAAGAAAGMPGMGSFTKGSPLGNLFGSGG